MKSFREKTAGDASLPGLFSFFSGCGILDLGLEDSGFHIRFVNEWKDSFLRAYKHGRKLTEHTDPMFGYDSSDVNEFLTAKRLRELAGYMKKCRQTDVHVGFVGGPPCPDFSVGGKNRGRHGKNGSLSETYVQLICSLKPDFFIFENVKGLWRTSKHREFFEHLKTMLRTASYVTTERLVNCIEYGVPQDRQRIFLIGFRKQYLKDLGYEKGSLATRAFPWMSPRIHDADNVLSLPWPTVAPFSSEGITRCPEDIIKELTVQFWFERNQVEDHPNTVHVFKPRAGLKRFLCVQEGDDSRKSFKRLHRWRYSPTACYGNNEVHLHPYSARRLTVAEALAIQSLPKKFSLPEDMSLSDMFKTIGNGVPYLAARGIAQTIKLLIRGRE